MKVSVTIELTDDDRHALNWKHGKIGMATRQDIQKWVARTVEYAIVDYRSGRDADSGNSGQRD